MPVIALIAQKGLRHFFRFVLNSWRWSLRHPRKLAVVFVLALVFFLAQLPNLSAELRVYDIADPKFPSTEQLRDMKRDFGDGNSILLLFSGENGSPLSNRQACLIRDWLSRVEGPDFPLSSEILSVESPFFAVKPVLKRSRVEFKPLLVINQCDENPFSARTLSASPWRGIVTDPSGSDLAAQISFHDTRGTSRYGKFDPAPIGALWDDLNKELLHGSNGKPSRLRVLLGGRASFQWYYKLAMNHDGFINLLVLVVLLLFFRVLYGTWKSGLILLFIILSSAVFIFGAMSFVGSPVDYLSNGLFLMMCIAAVEDFVFISHQQLTASQLAKPCHQWRSSLRSLLLPGFFTSVTTLVGFLSLETADLAIIRRFGFWAGWAAVCEWGITFYAVPILLRAGNIRKHWVEPESAHFSHIVKKLSGFSLPRPLLMISGFLFVFSIYGFTRLNFNDSPRDNFPKTHMQHQAYDYLRQSRGWEGPVFVIFPNAVSEDDNKTALREIALDSNVATIQSPYDMRDYFLRGFAEDYQRWIKVMLSMSPTYVGMFSKNDSARATVYLKSLNLADLKKTLDHIAKSCAQSQCYAAGESAVYAEYSKQVVGTLIRSFGSSLLLVGGIILLLSFGLGVKAKLGLLFSVFWSPVLVIGALAAFQIPVNFTTSMFASVLVGLTGDNAVQYLFASRRGTLQNGIRKRSGASVHVTVIAATASLFFLGLTLVPLKILGALLFFGFLISLAGDLWVLNGITRPRT